ncbi:MAG: hypothetical protein JKX72_09905 [Robiginitomaculum sp.]|nr:hypothetical protein [Robiginitomaculum sp.]
MTQGHTLSGPPNPIQSLLRIIFLGVAAVAGFFMLAASAAFALFVVLGVLVLGFVVFAVLWVKAKITGKPILAAFVPKSSRQHFEAFHEMQQAASKRTPEKNQQPHDGPIIDAHETPDGWSVDTE